MKLKRFIAADARTAMQQIKAAFGPDAVILSSHRVKDGVEVVAAIDFDETLLTAEAAVATAEPPSQSASNAVASPLDDMRQEIQTLRGMLEAQLKASPGVGEPLHALIMQKLYNLGISPLMATRLAASLSLTINQQQAWTQVLNQLRIQLPVSKLPKIEEGGVYAFVGPTGVGKTTTLAKIAARFALRFGAENLGLITMDTYRIAAEEQLLVYGKILGINVCTARDEGSLSRILGQMGDKKLILIDTAGMNPADERMDAQLKILSQEHRRISNVLVLSANSHYQSLIDSIRRYQRSSIEQCILTKLDESVAIGGAISALAESGLAVSYLANGQRVPEDIKMATGHQLIDLLAQQATQLSQQAIPIQNRKNEVGREFYVEG